MNARRDEGVVLLALVTTMVPLLLIVGAFTAAMSTRTAEHQGVLDSERALLAAESGIDESLFRAQVGKLEDGKQFQRNLGGGMEFVVSPTYLGSDGSDNDGDGNTDESDEDVFQVEVVGTYKNAERRLAAYLGPVPLLPTLSLAGAMSFYNPGVTISMGGTAQVSGIDTNIDGSLTGSSEYGMTVATPGTVSDLTKTISKKEASNILGDGGSPSVSTQSPEDLATIVAQVQNSANVVLTSDKYSSYFFGDGSKGDANIIYRNGDVTFSGNSQGSGIMVVTGNLTMTGTFRFDGVIIVLGNIENSAGTAQIYGGLIQGSSGSSFTLKGTADIRYSSEGLNLANVTSGTYVTFNGWQELGR